MKKEKKDREARRNRNRKEGIKSGRVEGRKEHGVKLAGETKERQ